MTEYNKFGFIESETDTQADDSVTQISPSGDAVVSNGAIDDIQIRVEPATVSSLTIFDDEKKKELEYIDDPSKSPPRTPYQNLQYMVQSVLEHIVFRLATVLLILLDFIITIYLSVKSSSNNNNALENISHVIICFFVLEVGLRIFYMEKRFFYSWVEVVDMIVVLLSFIVDMVFFVMTKDKEDMVYAKLAVIGRVFRAIRIGRIVYFLIAQRRHVSTATRRVVSQNKRRYQKDGFDLDLCYITATVAITERVIAMSFPSKGLMAVYRNPVRTINKTVEILMRAGSSGSALFANVLFIEEVARFFDTKHKDHYRLYNLCSERDYDETLFHNNVERIYTDDHNVATVGEIIWFAKNAREWMEKDKRNVIAIHCKGGKGRTGTIICVWLVECGIFEDAKESLEYFGDRRTDLDVGTKFQGVETPSQSRFVEYFEKVKKIYNGEAPPRKELKIVSFKIESIAGVGNGDGTDFTIELRNGGLLLFECRVGEQANCERSHDKESDSLVITLKNCPVLADDIKVRFISTNKKFPKMWDKCAFYFWFHTSFIEDNRLRLTRPQIDNPHKKKAHKVFRETFAIEVNFEEEASAC